MNGYEQYFNWPDVHIEHFYAYFLLALATTSYLVFKSESKYKFELFFIVFYLLTGNINKLLTIKIPGISLFEIQPHRFLFLLFCFFIIRKTMLAKGRIHFPVLNRLPWFMVALIAFLIFLITSVVYNSTEMSFENVLVTIYEAVAVLVFIGALALMRDNPSYELIGKSIIIGAVATSLVSIIQLSIDPHFLRIGDNRMAFGDTMRSNGIFSVEYFHSYYLIIAITWTLITIQKKNLKYMLVGLFTLGVLASFQRMSWIVLAIIIFIYFVYIYRMAFGKLVFFGLSGLALVLTVALIFSQDIMKSSVVEERLFDTIGGRAGYYTLALDNIGKKPLLGYGDLQNDVYYDNMLRITRNRDRAAAVTGDLHSGYFSALFLYGIPAFVCFSLFVILAIFYYAKKSNEHSLFVIAFLVSIIYMVGNLTNNFIFLKYVSILFIIHIGIAMGMTKIQEHNAKT